MRYDSAKLPLQTLLSPTAAATAAIARFDERLNRSSFRDGLVSRGHFTDACASLWVDGELVHLEDLVLHDAHSGVRAPSHELTIAFDVLRMRRRIAGNPPGWALSDEGLHRLRGGAEDRILPNTAPAQTGNENSAPIAYQRDDEEADALALELARMDEVIARTNTLLSNPSPTQGGGQVLRERNTLIYEPDWDENERLAEWRSFLAETVDLPPALRAALALDAWNQLQVLQHAPWLGRLLAASILCDGGVAIAHLPSINTGLKSVGRERRMSSDRNTRIFAILDALTEGANLGLKEHDRLSLAHQQMQHRLNGRRKSSKLPQLIELIMSKPMVSAAMIADEIGVTPQGALKVAAQLNLRELTGRGRFRAWGIL